MNRALDACDRLAMALAADDESLEQRLRDIAPGLRGPWPGLDESWDTWAAYAILSMVRLALATPDCAATPESRRLFLLRLFDDDGGCCFGMGRRLLIDEFRSRDLLESAMDSERGPVALSFLARARSEEPEGPGRSMIGLFQDLIASCVGNLSLSDLGWLRPKALVKEVLAGSLTIKIGFRVDRTEKTLSYHVQPCPFGPRKP